MVKDYHLAEDILQETFTKIIRNEEKFEKGSNAKAWIYKIAKNTAINYINKRRNEELMDELFIKDNRDFHEEVESTMEFIRLIAPLSEEERVILALRLSSNLSYVEISKLLNISVINLRKKYSRAIKKHKTSNENVKEA